MDEKIKENFNKRVEIFEYVWKEFFKDKPRPKNDEEDLAQQEEFNKFLKEKYGVDFNFIR